MRSCSYDAVFSSVLLMCKPVRPSGVHQSRASIGANRWRGGFATPRQVAVSACHPTRKTRQVGFVVVPQLRHVNEADVRDGLRRVHVEQQLINELAAQTPVPDREVFEFNQPLQVDAHLGQAPAAEVAQFLSTVCLR